MKFQLFLIFLISSIQLSFHSQTINRLPCIDKEFNVVVHIFKDSLGNSDISETVINMNFDSLNVDFSPICASFNICEFVYHSNFQYDTLLTDYEWGEVKNLYNREKRINVYYVNEILFLMPKEVCGFATLSGIGMLYDSGIAIKKFDCCGPDSKTLSHEFGHYFGLMHTWEADLGAELADGSNCSTSGDFICDTPADPFIEGDDPNDYVDPNTCQFYSLKKDANNQFYNPLVGNIMSYYQDQCNCGFTYQQYLKMANTYLNNIGMW